MNQTERDIEIILVDDGSTDGSGELCDVLASDDQRIRVIHKENGGLSSARNTGTEAATANYIMYLDGDDYLREDAVERAFRVMEEHPSDFVQFMYQEVEEGEIPHPQAERALIYQAHTSKELFENLYRLGGVAASGATKLFRRDLTMKIPFEAIRHEDEMWCTRAFQKNLTATYISDELYYYVMRKGSIIHSAFNRNKLDSFKVSEERLKVLRELGLEDLLGREYEKLFYAILRLYSEAKNAKDDKSTLQIQSLFEKNKNAIKQCTKLQGKLKLIFQLMCCNFAFAEIYRFYWKVKRN